MKRIKHNCIKNITFEIIQSNKSTEKQSQKKSSSAIFPFAAPENFRADLPSFFSISGFSHMQLHASTFSCLLSP